VGSERGNSFWEITCDICSGRGAAEAAAAEAAAAADTDTDAPLGRHDSPGVQKPQSHQRPPFPLGITSTTRPVDPVTWQPFGDSSTATEPLGC